MKNTILFILLLPLYCTAQFSLTGTIRTTEEVIPFANIIIMNTANEFVSGTTTNDDGSFELFLDKGNYTLNISHLNYKETDIAIQLDKNLSLGEILANEMANELDEVVVTTSRSTIKREIDRTVVNIENNLIAQSGNLFEALQDAPGLRISNDQIAMLGKSSVRVAVDGRLIQLSGNDLSEYLKTIAASDIIAIEIITNPPARYEAEGDSGIVNIITKKLKKESWSNNISLTHTQAKYGRQLLNNSFNFQKNKFSLLLTTAVNTGKDYILQIVEPNYSDFPQNIRSSQTSRQNSFSPRVLLDYNINSSTVMGVQYLSSFSRRQVLDNLKTTLFNNNYEVINYLVANDTKVNSDRNNSSYNFYFDKKLDTLGRRIIFNFDVLDYNGGSSTAISSDRFDPQLKFINNEFSNQGDAQYQVMNYSAKLDIEQPLKGMNLSYGANSSFSNTDYQQDNYNTLSGEAIWISAQSNEFNFKEQIHAGYINTNKKFNDRWEMQVGLRAEYTQTKGISQESDVAMPIFKNSYFKVFPTVYLQNNYNEDHVFSLNYGRRINRPAYSQLNPARTFLSSQSSQLGNPFLSPAYTDNVEFSHTYKYNFNTTVRFRHNSDAYSFIFDLNDETQEQTITYRNIFKENQFSIMNSYQLNPAPWWNARALFFCSYSNATKLDPNDNVSLMNGIGCYASIHNQFNLNKAKTISGELNYWFDSPYKANLYGFGKSHSLDLAISFKSLIKGMNLTIAANDIFFTSPRIVNSTVNSVEHKFSAYPGSRFIRVALSYRFGNEKISNQQRNFGNEDIRNRSN